MTPPLFAEYTQMDQLTPTISIFEVTIFLDGQAVTISVEESVWEALEKWFYNSTHRSYGSNLGTTHTLVGMTCGLGEPQPIKLTLSSLKVSAIAQHL